MSVKDDADEFVVKISGPGLVFERGATAERVHRIMSLLLQPTAATPNQSDVSLPETAAVSTINGGDSPKVFMANKRPKTDMERITCLAFYLTHSRGVQYFKTRDLTDLNKEAAQPQLSNPTVA